MWPLPWPHCFLLDSCPHSYKFVILISHIWVCCMKKAQESILNDLLTHLCTPLRWKMRDLKFLNYHLMHKLPQGGKWLTEIIDFHPLFNNWALFLSSCCCDYKSLSRNECCSSVSLSWSILAVMEDNRKKNLNSVHLGAEWWNLSFLLFGFWRGSHVSFWELLVENFWKIFFWVAFARKVVSFSYLFYLVKVCFCRPSFVVSYC